MAMLPRERLLCALNQGVPDAVPYFEYSISPDIVQRVFGHCPKDPREFNRLVGKADLEVWCKPPLFARYETTSDGRAHLAEGLIHTRDDYHQLFKLPDPLKFGKGGVKPAAMEDAARAVDHKGEFAAGLVISLSADSTLLSMGLDGIAYALADDPGLIGEVLDRYADWTIAVLEAYQQLDFDFILCGDDLAHKTAPFISPPVFRDLFWPRMKRVADTIRRPWILHSDGNLMPIMTDLLALGMSGLNPIEPGALDIFELKQRLGGRLCLIGNFDLNILARGTPEETRQEVETKLKALAPGGGYIAASSNSIPDYVKPENFRAMAEAIREFSVRSAPPET